MSRLLEGNIEYNGQDIPIEEYREMIFARSLYSIDNEYENTNKFSLNNKGNVASSISTVLNVVPQYNRMQINTNLLGNTYDAFRDDGSALAQIGLVMLGKQMAYNSAMNLSTKYMPSIDLSQALKGNPENIFKLKKDNTITVINPEDKTFLDKVGSVASNVLGIDTYDVFGDANPFSKNPTKIDYLKNTGNVQLSRFLGAVNLNIYKPLNDINDSQYTQVLTEKMNDVGPKLQSSEDSILNSNPNGIRPPIFNFDDSSAHRYFNRSLSSSAIESATKTMLASYSITGDTVQEYAPSYQYIKDNFGEAVEKNTENNILDVVKEQTNINDDSKQQIVWGRDGVADEAKSFIKDLRGTDDSIDNHGNTNIFNKNNIRKGLLEYTRNLLNASEGNFVDITRKAFKEGEDYIGFNGSPLWMANDSKYSDDSGNRIYVSSPLGDIRFGKIGIRQHTILDPYNRAAKTIRFKGNQVYSQAGNKDSVIYKNILPRIHPTSRNENGNKNLMFSLENLAVGTIRRDKYGVIDDEYGTAIPLTEVGQFGGRKMWFPPYNIQLNEVAAAKYESTVMVGRNEPMYNYMNSERSAVLSFSLLVDYPEQLKNANLRGENKNKVIADFFAFGGDPLPTEYEIEQIEKRIEDLENKLENDNPSEQAEPPDKGTGSVNIYFQNDSPKSGQELRIIQTMYDNNYEISSEVLSKNGSASFGLNDEIYVIKGLVENPNNIDNNIYNRYIVIGNSEQYDYGEVFSPNGEIIQLNRLLKDFFADVDYRKYYKIKISGYASKLYLTEGQQKYNKKLAQRRIDAAIALIKARLAAIFDGTTAKDVIDNNVEITVVGSDKGVSDAGEFPENIDTEEVRRDRRVEIIFERNNIEVDKKEDEVSPAKRKRNEEIREEILELENKLKSISTRENVFKERDDVVLNGFESIAKNKYYPVFHSQTPEDFHRRLTFLQQCTRQGAAKRYDAVDEDGILRAKNSVFGKQPICILRVGDFFNTKVVIESVTIDYNDTTWDLNPEGFGLQPMMANITLQMKLIGGQSLQAPVDALQNAVSFNYYANSTFSNEGVYDRASKEADKNYGYLMGIVEERRDELNKAYELIDNKKETE